MGNLRTLGWCIIIGALGILAFSGVSMWHSAFDLNAKYPHLAAIGAVSYLAVECLGLGVAYTLWQHRAKVFSVGAVILTLAMALYLVRLDLNVNVGGRADREAQREASYEERRSERTELAQQKALRDQLQGQKKLTADQRRALGDARRRIVALEQRWGAHEVVAEERTPDAGWVARWLGVDIQSVDDIMAALPVFLQVLVRLMLLPIGLRLLQLANERDEELRRLALASRNEPIKDLTKSLASHTVVKDSDTEVDGEVPVLAPPVHTGPRLGPEGRRPRILNEAIGRPRSPVLYDRIESPIARPAAKAQTKGSVAAFIADMMVRDGAEHDTGVPLYLLKSSKAHEAYRNWCASRVGKGITPLDAARFGRAFTAATGQTATTRSNGAFYPYWRLKTEVETEEAGQSARVPGAALAAVA